MWPTDRPLLNHVLCWYAGDRRRHGLPHAHAPQSTSPPALLPLPFILSMFHAPTCPVGTQVVDAGMDYRTRTPLLSSVVQVGVGAVV